MIHPYSPPIPAPGAALLARRSADLSQELDHHAPSVHLANDALPIVRCTSDAVSRHVPARRVDRELSATTSIHPNTAIVPAPGSAQFTRCAADLAQQLHTASRIDLAVYALAVVRRADEPGRSTTVAGAVAVPIPAAITPIAKVSYTAQSETLVGITVHVEYLNANAVARGSIRNIQRSTEARDDHGVAVLAGFEAPLLTGTTVEGNSPNGFGPPSATGIQRVTIHGVADVHESVGTRCDIPGLIVGPTRGELNYGCLIVAIEVQDSPGLQIRDFVPPRSAKTTLAEKRQAYGGGT